MPEPWVKLDVTAWANAKVMRAMAANPWAGYVWAGSIAYCQRELTDGHVPAHALAECIPPAIVLRVAGEADEIVAALEAAGLWERNGDGWNVHDYLEHQQSRKQVEAFREMQAEKGRRNTGPRRRRKPAAKPTAKPRAKPAAEPAAEPADEHHSPYTNHHRESTTTADTTQTGTAASAAVQGERPRNVLWDALAEAVGYSPQDDGERRLWGRLVKQLGEYHVEPRHVAAAAQLYVADMPGATLTAQALVKHLPRLIQQAQSGRVAGARDPAARTRAQAAALRERERQGGGQ